MKVTLKDIAEDTGYSISTVSRVLNGFETKERTKKQIVQSARKLNYPIQNFQKGVHSNGMLDILLITGIEVGEVYASFFDGINNAASRENVRLSLSSLQNKIPKAQDIANKIKDESFDGLIINMPRFTKVHYRELQKLIPDDFPVISNEVLDNQIFDTVDFDNYGGGELVAKHFGSQNYETCGIIYGPDTKNAARQRAHGFKDYVKYVSSMKLIWRSKGDFSFDSGLSAFENFEKAENKPRAVFACNDNMAQAFIQEAMVKGYQIPDDIAVVGFDDLPHCTRHRPKISSVRTNYEQLGAVSIQRMKELLANPDKPRGVLSLLPTKLIERESS